MPYIGNNHIAGDHTNNFKVLDDISSFTATFDGSASSVVDTTNNTIRVVEHRFIQGQRVTYTNGGGGNIGGLTTGTAYFVIFDSASTIKLATNASNAASSTAINLSAVGTGSSHTLNVAFDGVNTKFKLTHGSGTGARLNNATQINVAINNVVQRPNLDPNNFTDGFALEDNHKIVFQTAPTNQDIFWGSIIANTLTTFDISDHKIDTFTGDGSTTEFTLSHTPANNESLMVTINGVLQHPSNASTARAYTLIASIIEFTAAPGVGDEIQVRHLGFAGATTADVSGFYGRTGNVALTANDHITTGDISARNINASGILTASSASFGGNVSIGGTLTYEDVTNIDSVGIITARNGIDCNGDLDVDGHTNLDNVSIAGVTTFSGDLNIAENIIHTGDTNTKISFPSNDTIQLKAASNTTTLENLKSTFTRPIRVSDYIAHSTVDSIGVKFFNQGTGNNNTFIGLGAEDNGTANGTTHKTFRVYRQGSSVNRVNIDNFGNLNALQGFTVAGISTFSSNIDANGDLDVDGHTNLDNVSIAGVTTITGILYSGSSVRINTTDDQALRLNSTDNGPIYMRFDRSGSRKAWIGYGNANNVLQLRNEISDGDLYFSVNDGGSTKTAISIDASENAKVNIPQDLDVDGHTNLDNVSIAGVATATTFSGSGASLTSIANANISASAAIAGSKITPNFGSQTLTSGLVYSTGLYSTGTLNLTGGSVQINLNRASHSPNYRIHLTGGSNATMNFRIQDTTNNLSRFIIRHGGQIEIPGDVGIGHPVNYSTTNISKFGSYSTLHIKGPSNEGAAIRLQDNGDTADSDDFVIYKNSSAAYLRVNGTDPLIAYMNGAERLRIDSIGRLLVNRTAAYASSSERLSVNGVTSIQGSSTSTANLYVFNTNTTADGTVQPYIFLHDGSGIRGGLGCQYNTSNLVINGQSAIQFRTGASGVGGTERLRIDSSGVSTFKNKIIIDDGTNGHLFFNNTSSGNQIASGTTGFAGYKDLKINGGQLKFLISNVERARINTSGNVMIGRTDGAKKFSVKESSTSSGVHFAQTIGGSSHVSGYAVGLGFDPEGYSQRNKIAIVAEGTGNGYSRGKLHFLLDNNNNSSEVALNNSRMFITDDGQIGMGAPSTYTDPYRLYLRYYYSGSAGYANGLVIDSRPDVLTTKHIRFYYALHGSGGGSELGSITSSNAGSVSYNTSSDYRRKQNDVVITDGIAKVKSLRPIRFNWIDQPEITEEGFFAHEAQEVVPNSVFGEKDALDNDGKPDYQVMDHSKLVPLLTASIKDLIAKVEKLEEDNIALRARVTTLEGN